MGGTIDQPLNRVSLRAHSCVKTVLFNEIVFSNKISSNSLAFNTVLINGIEVPLDNKIFTDFNYWELQWTASSTETYNINVQYGQAPSTYDYIDTDNFVGIEGQPMQASMIKKHSLSDGDWYVRATLYDSNGDLVAYTGEISFLIDSTATTTINSNGYPNGSGVGYNPAATTTLNELNTTCDATSNFFTSSLCNMFFYLFAPSDTVLTRYTSLKVTIPLRRKQNEMKKINLATSYQH